MSLEVTMPQMGESVVEGTVTRWLVKVGDRVTEDQPLCEISTDKVDTEIPSPASGVIAELLAAEGQTLPIGSKIAVIETAAAATADVRAAAPAPAPPPRRTTATPPQTAAAEPPPAVDAGPAAPVAAPVRPSMGAAARATNGAPRRYSPVVLRMAEEHGIDLSAVPGTGIGGRVSKRDVERYLETLRRGDAVDAVELSEL